MLCFHDFDDIREYSDFLVHGNTVRDFFSCMYLFGNCNMPLSNAHIFFRIFGYNILGIYNLIFQGYVQFDKNVVNVSIHTRVVWGGLHTFWLQHSLETHNVACLLIGFTHYLPVYFFSMTEDIFRFPSRHTTAGHVPVHLNKVDTASTNTSFKRLPSFPYGYSSINTLGPVQGE